MSYEQKKMEYEGKVQHKKDVESFNKIKAETKARYEAAIAQGKSHRVDIEAQIARAKELGKIKK